MSFDEWLQYGIDNDYCSPQFCNTHDGGPMLEAEHDIWDKGLDPCVHMVRLGCPQDWQLDAEAYKEISDEF
jgi:hypothetical protein